MQEAERPRILIVDDEPHNRVLCRKWLGAEYDVIEACDGHAALDAMGREPVDLVLLDVMMPALNGFEVCKRIKQSPGTFLPVVFLTALGAQDERVAGLAAGGDDFLTKPVDRHELLLRVRALLRLRRQELVIREQLRAVNELQTLKDDLVSLIVHDLRNPLAGIIGHLEVLEIELRGSNSRQAMEDVAQALRIAARLRTLLDEVLRVRQLEEGKLELRREPVQLAEVVREAMATFEADARVRGVTLAAQLDATPALLADRALLRRALENLLANALRFSSSGASVDVVLQARDGRIDVEVMDRGPGVPDELKNAVFDKFASLQSRPRETRRGFGLGLYLVNLAVAAHGGTASVRDREGGGAVFLLSFPR